jgi:hypothetical protein
MKARAFRVRCTDMDSADTYRFELTHVSRKSAGFRAYIESLPNEARTLDFAASCFDGGQGVLGMSQTNAVSHEAAGAARFHDTTPPFFLSAAHAEHARQHDEIRGLRFFDFLGASPVLTRAADVTRELTVFGKKRALVAECYAGRYAQDDRIEFVRGLDQFTDAAILLCLVRDAEFSVQLEAIES